MRRPFVAAVEVIYAWLVRPDRPHRPNSLRSPMFQSITTCSVTRFRVLLVGLLAAILVLFAQVGWPPRGLTGMPLHDFVEYWAAGYLNLHGENPYDPDRIQELEQAVGRDTPGILMWNPPWTLSLVMPLGLLSCRTAHLVWLLVHFLVLAWCADALWRRYGGPLEQRWLSWVLAFTFLPTIFTLTAGQIAPLVLLGAALFLVCIHQGRDGLAGAATVLLAIKPHLSYLFWLALLLWTVRERRWKGIAAGLLAGLLALVVPLYFNPAVLHQYWHTFTSQPPAQYRSPTLGTAVRLLIGEGHFRLQFLALIPGLVWFVPYWLRRRGAWDWSEQLPVLLLISFLTAAYGAWPFDLVVLLVPVLQVAAEILREEQRGLGWLALSLYLAIEGIALLQLLCGVEYFWFLWMTPVLLLAYLGLQPRRRTSRLAPHMVCP
jgi:hypothetical protein